MNNLLIITQVLFTAVMGMYFFSKIRGETADGSALKKKSAQEAERLNALRRIKLSEPLTEMARPKKLEDVVGQSNGIKAVTAALCGPHPQHMLIYGPPGVGKTAVARLALERAKLSPGTPFKKNAKFIEADATTMQYDERSIADALIGSVHDPIYQGAGAFGLSGIPEPKAGAVSKAHGGVLFIDEIGELCHYQMNRLLKVLEDRRVFFESAYYNEADKNIPQYIHDIFKNGLPADFRLIGATTRKPEEIPEALRSRCAEIFFNPLSERDRYTIVQRACVRLDMSIEERAAVLIAKYTHSGRDAVKILQMAQNTVSLEARTKITADDVVWTLNSCGYSTSAPNAASDKGKIIGVEFVQPGI